MDENDDPDGSPDAASVLNVRHTLPPGATGDEEGLPPLERSKDLNTADPSTQEVKRSGQRHKLCGHYTY